MGENRVPFNRFLGPSPKVAVITQEHNSQRLFVAAQAAALRNVTIMAPRLVKLPAAHLAGSLVNPVQVIAADDAGLRFQFFIRGQSALLEPEILGPAAFRLRRYQPSHLTWRFSIL